MFKRKICVLMSLDAPEGSDGDGEGSDGERRLHYVLRTNPQVARIVSRVTVGIHQRGPLLFDGYRWQPPQQLLEPRAATMPAMVSDVVVMLQDALNQGDSSLHCPPLHWQHGWRDWSLQVLKKISSSMPDNWLDCVGSTDSDFVAVARRIPI